MALIEKVAQGAGGSSPWAVSGMVTLAGQPVAVSGTVTVNQGTPPWAVSGSVTLAGQPIAVSGTVTASDYSYRNLATTGTTTLLTGAGTLHTVTINKRGLGSPLGTLTLYDSLSASGTIVATIDTTLSVTTLRYDARLTTGLTAVLAGGTAADVTVTWK